MTAVGDPDRVSAVIGDALTGLGMQFESTGPRQFLVHLPGDNRLDTATWLAVTDHALVLEAFFMRQPDVNHAQLYRFLLERNARMYGVHFAADDAGDIYLIGRIPLSAVDATEIDRLLGCVLSYSDETFNTAVEIGFADAIRREHAWRVRRGLPVDNLSRFAHLIED